MDFLLSFGKELGITSNAIVYCTSYIIFTHSKLVKSSRFPSLLLRSIGLSLTSIPGPTDLRVAGKTYTNEVINMRPGIEKKRGAFPQSRITYS